jgi:hypothetical protein
VVAIDRDSFMQEPPTDILQALARYAYVAKVGIDRKTIAELKGKK